MTLKLIDFENAKELTIEDARTWSPVGFSKTRAPEVFDSIKGYNKSINLYSLGNFIYYLKFGHFALFNNTDPKMV